MPRPKVNTVNAQLRLPAPLYELFVSAAKLGYYGSTTAEVMRAMLVQAAETNPILSKLAQRDITRRLGTDEGEGH